MHTSTTHHQLNPTSNAARVQNELTSLPPVRGDGLIIKGTSSSNTVPSTCINQYNTKILRNGIDSLYLSYQGELSDEGSIKLSELKKLVQSNDPRNVGRQQIWLDVTHI